MSFRLWIASYWVPPFLLLSEIDHVAMVTVNCLDDLLLKYAPSKLSIIQKDKFHMEGNINNRRKLMAKAHNVRVKALIDALGYEDAMKIGRKALFQAGLKLGQEARERLGVGDSLQDLIRSARVLYHVLGIEFKVDIHGKENKVNDLHIIISKCSLSSYYTAETCQILSAADEGVVQGLNENIQMKFTQRMTEGPSECMACIKSNI